MSLVWRKFFYQKMLFRKVELFIFFFKYRMLFLFWPFHWRDFKGIYHSKMHQFINGATFILLCINAHFLNIILFRKSVAHRQTMGHWRGDHESQPMRAFGVGPRLLKRAHGPGTPELNGKVLNFFKTAELVEQTTPFRLPSFSHVLFYQCPRPTKM